MCLYVLGFLTMKMKAFRVTQNDSPKMVKMSASNNKLSRFGWNKYLVTMMLSIFVIPCWIVHEYFFHEGKSEMR